MAEVVVRQGQELHEEEQLVLVVVEQDLAVWECQKQRIDLELDLVSYSHTNDHENFCDIIKTALISNFTNNAVEFTPDENKMTTNPKLKSKIDFERVDIDGTCINFPFKPYEIQLDYMR